MKLLSCCCLLLLTTCSIEDRIENREDRLIGTWIIERASFMGDNALFGDNVTDEFRGDLITFYSDYTLFYEPADGSIFDGNWSISALRDRGDDDDEVEFLLDADFFDPDGRLSFHWIGTIDRLGRDNFNLTLSERTGELRLRWDRY